MGRCPLSDPDHFIDTNAMLFGRAAFPLLHQWVLMPDYGHLIGDRIMLDTVKRSEIRRSHVDSTEVFYRCNKAGLYRQMGEAIPEVCSRDRITRPPSASGRPMAIRR